MDLADELERAQGAFADFIEFLPMALVEIDLATLRLTKVNRLARILMGFDPAEALPPLTSADLVPPDEHERILAITADYYRTGLQPDGSYRKNGLQELHETTGKRRDGSTFPVEFQSAFVLDSSSVPVAAQVMFRDISERKQRDEERDRLTEELQRALANVRTLRGLLPVCAWCKKVRHDDGYWSELETYVRAHSEATFSHGICPECAERYRPGASSSA